MAAIGSTWASGSWVSVGGWAAGTWADAGSGTLPFTGDMNTRLLQFLRDHYSTTNGDLTTLATRYMNGLTTGDRNQKFQQLMADAAAAMS